MKIENVLLESNIDDKIKAGLPYANVVTIILSR